MIDLGLAVVEPEIESGAVLLVMLPDGEVRIALHAGQAAAIIGRWQAKRTPKDGAAILKIEWRGCKPPVAPSAHAEGKGTR